MWDLHARVVACAEGAARATGCTLSVIDFEAPYEPLKRNDTLLELFRANMKTTGAVESPPIPDRMGSSDIGNVSQVIPAIQPMVQIAPHGTPIHSRAFEAAAVSALARQGMCQAAKTMALTTFDLLADPSLVTRARREFDASR
jgi:metal-dependent amidase/aminoacylase/carboxypeptidase family protein